MDGTPRGRTVSRRSFLAAVAVAGGGAVAAPHLLRFLDRDAAGTTFGRMEAARRVGRAYLEQHPAERDARALEVALFGTAGGAWDVRRAAAQWETACRDDFTLGRVVPVEGWWLALSEARLCALVSLGAETAA